MRELIIIIMVLNDANSNHAAQVVNNFMVETQIATPPG